MRARHAIIGAVLIFQGAAWAQPSPLMADYNRAWRLAGQEKPDEAVPIIHSIIRRDKTFWRAYRLYADLAHLEGTTGKAVEYFRSLLRDDDGNALAWYGLGRVAYQLQSWDESASHFSQCIALGPSIPACYADFAFVLSRGRNGNEGTTIEEVRRRLPDTANSVLKHLVFAQAYVERRELERARAHADVGLQAAEEIDNEALVAEFRQLLTGILLQQNDFERLSIEIGLLLKYAQQLGDEELELIVGVGSISVLEHEGRWEEVIRLRESRVAALRLLGHVRLILRDLSGLAAAYDRVGDIRRAIELDEESIRVLRATRRNVDAPGVVNAHLRIARRYWILGRFDEAVRTAERALEEAEKLKFSNRSTTAFAQRTLSHAHRYSGDYFRALQLAVESVGVFQSQGMPWQAGAGLGNIGALYGELGDWDTAFRYTQASYESGVRHQDLGEQQRNLMALGQISLAAGKPQNAVRYLTRAHDMAEKVGFAPFNAATLFSLGEAYGVIGDSVRCANFLTRALAAYEQLGDRPSQADSLIGLGTVALKGNRLTEAEKQFRAGLALGEEMGYRPAILAARRGLADVEQRRSKAGAALIHYEAAIREAETLRGRRLNADQRTSFTEQNWLLYEETVDLLWRLHVRHPGAGYDRKAFEVAEMGRARSLLDTLDLTRSSVRKGLNEAQLRRQGELYEDLTLASENLLKASTAARRRTYDGALKRVKAWIDELRQQGFEFSELQYPQPKSLKEIEESLTRNGSVLMQYLLGGRRSFLWVVGGGPTRMYALPTRAVIEGQVRAFREKLTTPPRGTDSYEAWLPPAEGLYHQLIAPAAGQLRVAKHVMVVPDGILHYLPFEALVRREDATGFKTLLEAHSLSYAPSASVHMKLQAVERVKEVERRMELLAYGDPVFGKEEESQGEGLQSLVRGVYDGAGMRFQRLPSSGEEVRLVGSLLEVDKRRLRLREDATEDSVKREPLSGYKWLHFATHAILDERVPARSGVVLSLVNTGREDGVLTLGEIFNLDLRADLVVLSACHTGLGKVVKGEGIVGLTRGFLYAGTQRVVVSLWQVNDLATPELMHRFYRGLKNGASISAALRAAKLGMLRSDSKLYRHPYFWAPFVLVGAR